MSGIHHRAHRWLAPAVVALAALLLPSVAAAQSAPPPASSTQKGPPQDKSPHALFARIDTNSDGKVSKQEVTRMPGIATRWQELDKDRDGSLSREEFVASFRT